MFQKYLIKLSLFHIFFLPLFAFSQNKKNISGQIFDIKGQPVSYSIITNKNRTVGLSSDSLGKFEISMAKTDTLLISNIGHYSKAIPVIGISDSNIKIILEENVKEFNPIYVTLNRKKIMLGEKTKRKMFKSMTFSNIRIENFEYGLHIKNPANYLGTIKSVGYYISNANKPKTPFRIRIYEITEKGFPGKDLLPKGLVVSSKKSGWFDVDISQFGIPFGEKGVVVSMEWLNIDPNKNKLSQSIEAVRSTDPKIYFSRKNQGYWIRYKIPNDSEVYQNPMIRCEILTN